MKKIIIFIILGSLKVAWAIEFSDLIRLVEENKLLTAKIDQVKVWEERAKQDGSWGDPVLSVSAMYLPVGSLSLNESMMSGVQFDLSQTLSLSGTYKKQREAGIYASKVYRAQSELFKRELVKGVWLFAIQKDLLVQEEEVFKENLEWIKGSLKVTEGLYATGKVSQQALLEMQIRRSELTSLLIQKEKQLEALRYELDAMLGTNKKMDVRPSSVPWGHLEKWEDLEAKHDSKEEALRHKLKASELNLSAQTRNLIPDITVGVNYIKSNNLEGMGDFVGAHISIPLPTSDVRYAAKREATYSKFQAQKSYRHYLETRPAELAQMKSVIESLDQQIRILNKEILSFAKSSREITARSYSRGEASYSELLRSQLQYQGELLKKINLSAQLRKQKVDYLFTKGSALVPEVN